MISDEVSEREIEVDGEPVTITLLDTWDPEVRLKTTTWWFVYHMRYTTVLQPFYQLQLSFFVQMDSDKDQERFMQTGDAYLLLYSVTDRASFLHASELRITLRRFRPAHRTPIILVGNKCDLVRRREVSVNGEETRFLSDERCSPWVA